MTKLLLAGMFYCVVCSIAFPLQKAIILEVPPLFSMALRLLTTLPIWVFFLRKPKSGEMVKILRVSLLFVFGGIGILTIALQNLDAGVCAIAVQIPPIALVILGLFFFKEELTKLKVGGIGITIIGVYLLAGSPEFDLSDTRTNLALSIALSSYTLGLLQLRFMDTPPLQTMMWGYALALLPMTILSSFFEGSPLSLLQQAPPHLYLYALLAGVISVTTNSSLSYLLKNYPFNNIIPFKTMLPVFAIFWGWLLIGETFHPYAIKGGALILFGAVMVTWKKSENAQV